MSDDTRLYCLPTERVVQGRISGSRNLQEAFGLDSLARSVARVDEAGNKINKLSKTYKRQMESLGVPQPTDIPRNTFLLDLLLAGGAHRQLDDIGGYRLSEQDLDAFELRPGPLAGYRREGAHTNAGSSAHNRRKSRSASGVVAAAVAAAAAAATPASGSIANAGTNRSTGSGGGSGGGGVMATNGGRVSTGNTPINSAWPGPSPASIGHAAAAGHGTHGHTPAGTINAGATPGGGSSRDGDGGSVRHGAQTNGNNGNADEDDDDDDGGGAFAQGDRDRQRKRQMRREIEETAKRRRYE